MRKRLFPALIILSLLFCLNGCSMYERYKTEELTLVATEEDIQQLEDYPNLHYVDLSGSTCYQAIEDYITAHPEVEVVYTVDVLGQTYSPNATALDLSSMDAQSIPEVTESIKWLHNLKEINLMPTEGPSKLSVTEVKALAEACPDVTFNYRFDLFGQTIDINAERVEFVQTQIGDENEGQIRAALDIMPNCTYFKVDRCGLSSEVLAKIRDDYPDTKIVWRVFFGTKFNALTDETVLRSSHYLNNDNVSEMKYLTDVKYVDIGHNEVLTDISFLSYMPNLELLIVSGSSLTDLTPLANAKKLEFLELCFCGQLRDLSPLVGCESLKYLNISATKVCDLSPLENLPIERFNCILNPNMPSATKDAFVASHPDCLTVYTGKQPYGYGWRYIDDGYTFWDYYATMRQMFHYDEPALLNGYAWDEATKNDPW